MFNIDMRCPLFKFQIRSFLRMKLFGFFSKCSNLYVIRILYIKEGIEMRSVEEVKGIFLKNPNFNKVQDLLRESFETYTIGAYRSTYLTSYLAFLSQIRENILNYPKNPYKQIVKKKNNETDDDFKIRVKAKWEKLTRALNDEDIWEKSLLDALNEGHESNILRFTDNDRTSFMFFRNQRNSAAHVKAGSTTASMVQTLWEFMESFSKKIVVGGGKASFIELLETMERFYDVGEIPEERIAEFNESFIILSKDDQDQIVSDFYQQYKMGEVSNAYMKHITQILNGFFYHDKDHLYELLNENPILALFSTMVINELEVSNFKFDLQKIDPILDDSQRLLQKIRSFMLNNEAKNFSSNISNFLNLLAMPYHGHPHLPNTFNDIFFNIVERSLLQEIVSIKDLENFVLNKEVEHKLICYMLEKVEDSYSYNNGRVTVDIPTFSWNDISINKFYIIYLSNRTLVFPYPEKDRVDTVFSRLVDLYNEHVDRENPARDNNFLRNFDSMIDLLLEHGDLIKKISE